MPSVAVLVPVVGRPHKAAAFMESFRASGADATVYAIAEHDDPKSIKAWADAGAKVSSKHAWRTFAEKVNFAYQITDEDWIFLVGDDVVFHPGWLETAFATSPSTAKVIGIRDTDDPKPNKRVGHLLIEREYIDRIGASWDGPGVVCHVGYRHMYVDDEMICVAHRHGVYHYNTEAFVEHIHPHMGKAKYDEVYLRAAAAVPADFKLWLKRRQENMRVAVYGIALNEASNVEAWAESAQDAHCILLADTGSTDDTVTIARDCGIEVVELAIRPFRFDAAQNAAIAALPLDVDWCISLDLDERLQPGWRDALLKVPDEATRVGFWFVWEKTLDQMPEGDHWHEDCHRRTGYRWAGIVHEALLPYGFRPERRAHVKECQINHVPDRGKPRAGKYIEMIKMAILEDPKSERYSEWLSWSLEQEGRNEEAAVELKRYVSSVAMSPPKVADGFYKLSKVDPEHELEWLERAERTLPRHRQYKSRLAMYHYERKEWEQCIRWADAALAIAEPAGDVVDPGFAWTATLHEFRYMALFNTGRITEALEAAKVAADLAPDDKRIAKNILVIKNLLQGAAR